MKLQRKAVSFQIKFSPRRKNEVEIRTCNSFCPFKSGSIKTAPPQAGCKGRKDFLEHNSSIKELQEYGHLVNYAVSVKSKQRLIFFGLQEVGNSR